MKSKLRLVRLDEMATFMGGSTPSRARPEYFGGGIPWVKTTDLNNGRITETEETLTALGLSKSSCKLIPANAVLVAMYGGFNQIGRTGLLLHESAINQALTAILPNPQKLDPAFLLEWLNFRVAYWKRFAGSSRKDPNITKGDIADFPVPSTPIDQQKALVRVLSQWNAAVEITELLLALKSKRLNDLRDIHLQTPQHSTLKKLHAVTRESTDRNGKQLGREAIMAVTKQVGMRPMREETIAATIERYKVVRPQGFAYNPMRLNIGSIAMSNFETDVLVSPDYVVFECDKSKLLPGYLNHLRFSRHWKSFFEAAGNGSVRVRIYYYDLGTFAIQLPPIDKQERVIKLLDTTALEIEKLALYAKALRQQKRGLMNKLLTGQWRMRVSKSEAIA